MVRIRLECFLITTYKLSYGKVVFSQVCVCSPSCLLSMPWGRQTSPSEDRLSTGGRYASYWNAFLSSRAVKPWLSNRTFFLVTEHFFFLAKIDAITGVCEQFCYRSIFIFLQVTDSKGHVLYNKEDATKGKFAFTTEEYDVFEVCFESKMMGGKS